MAYDVPNEGRIKHHRAIVAHPDVLQQLFYYTTALVSVSPFLNIKKPLYSVIDAYKDRYPQQGSIVSALLATHSVLLSHGSTESFLTTEDGFLSHM